MTRDKRTPNKEIKTPRRGNWYLVTGLVIGILFGLVISWVIAPVKYLDTTPASLRADFKNEFRSQIASAYYATNNFARAKARLELLGDSDPIQALTNQAQNLLDAGDPTNTAFLLAYLTSALKQNPVSTLEVSSSPEIPEITITQIEKTSTNSPTETSLTITPATATNLPNNINTPTLRPTSTPSPTPGAEFILKSNETICNSPSKTLLLQVEVLNSANQPIPGAEILISWSGGEDHFFTGLKPEINDGYADYLMAPDVVYSIQLANGGSSVSNLTAPTCSTEASSTIWGSIKLLFQQP